MSKPSRPAKVAALSVLFLLAGSVFIASIMSLSSQGVQFKSCRRGPCTNLDLAVGSGIFSAVLLLALLATIFADKDDG
jgi:hypothetical protein